MAEKKRLDYLWTLYPTTFRNNVGSAWAGGQDFRATKDGVFPVRKGDLIIKNPGKVNYGLERGSADLIGYTIIEVTPEMVGSKVAVFTSVEDKSEKDKISLEQIIWLLRLRLDGAISEVFKEGIKLTLDQILKLPRRDHDKAKEGIIQRLCEKIR